MHGLLAIFCWLSCGCFKSASHKKSLSLKHSNLEDNRMVTRGHNCQSEELYTISLAFDVLLRASVSRGERGDGNSSNVKPCLICMVASRPHCLGRTHPGSMDPVSRNSSGFVMEPFSPISAQNPPQNGVVKTC